MSMDLDSQLQRLGAVLARLEKFNLRLTISKCKLLRTSVDFLGHHVSRHGVATQPDKVKAVTEWPPCKSAKEVKSFLGLSGYYRKFIKDYADIARPLTDLLKQSKEFFWSPACQAAQDRLKAALVSADILALSVDKFSYWLDTDASDHTIGCVLSQEQADETTKVIAYASKKLSPAEANYCVTRRELLAIVYYLKHFRHLLLGNKVVLRTDHAALIWLKRQKEPTGQSARWLQVIDEFNDMEILIILV
jgi:hypothetical protein